MRKAEGAMKRQGHEKQLTTTLVCLECRDESEHAIGWRAYRDDAGELLIYCGGCAAREFDC